MDQVCDGVVLVCLHGACKRSDGLQIAVSECLRCFIERRGGFVSNFGRGVKRGEIVSVLLQRL